MFGPLTIEIDDQVLGPSDLGGLKTKHVLEILLLARGRLVGKDALAEALWPKKLPKNVSATIETYISVLRRHLTADRDAARRLLVTLPGAYRLDDRRVDVDVWRFEDLVEQARRCEGPERLIVLTEAVGLVKGDLLEDTPYAEWVEPERRRCRERVVRANVQIATDALAIGDPVVALRHAEAAVRLDPLEETAWQAVMRAHHRLGHGDAAARALARCRRVLADELGVEPAPATVEAAGEGLDRLRTIGRAIPATAPAPNASSTASRDRRAGARHLPFLGRTQEIDRLLAAVEGCQSGRLEVVLVGARSGMGRTALLDQVHPRLAGPVGRFTYASHEVDLPSPPLAGALLEALASTAPEAARRYADFDEPARASERPAHLERLLRDNGPTVLLLDDLQWADDDTLTTIETLAQLAPDLPVAIIATVRRDLPRFAAVASALRSAAPVQLGPLDEDELGHLTPQHRQLLQMTGGHPGLMADHFRWVSSGHTGYSPSLVAAVKRQITGLGPDLAEMLRSAAALAEPVESFDLVHALDRSVADVTHLLLQALHLGVLELHDGGFRFREPAVQAILHATVPPEHRLHLAQSRLAPAPRLTDRDLASMAAARARRTARVRGPVADPCRHEQDCEAAACPARQVGGCEGTGGRGTGNAAVVPR